MDRGVRTVRETALLLVGLPHAVVALDKEPRCGTVQEIALLLAGVRVNRLEHAQEGLRCRRRRRRRRLIV